jgi:hypothetical protein
MEFREKPDFRLHAMAICSYVAMASSISYLFNNVVFEEVGASVTTLLLLTPGSFIVACFEYLIYSLPVHCGISFSLSTLWLVLLSIAVNVGLYVSCIALVRKLTARR